MTIRNFPFLLSALFLLFAWAGCTSKKENSQHVVTADLKRKQYVARTKSEEHKPTIRLSEEDSIRLAEIREREERKTKTIVIESMNNIGGCPFYAHVELAPDGKVKGDADFISGYMRRIHQSFTGSWRTGSVSRGTSNLTYYEINADGDDWYCTEEFDYLWRGEYAYSDMRDRKLSSAGEIIKIKYK